MQMCERIKKNPKKVEVKANFRNHIHSKLLDLYLKGKLIHLIYYIFVVDL